MWRRIDVILARRTRTGAREQTVEPLVERAAAKHPTTERRPSWRRALMISL